MRLKYNMCQQFIAVLLLVSLFLQSCGGVSNSLVPSEKKPTDNFRRLSKKIYIEQLVDQELTAAGGYVVNFYEHEGVLKADVKVDEFQKDPTYINLPVTIEKGTELAEVLQPNKKLQACRVQFQPPHHGKSGRILILKGGLSGGMREGDEDPKGKEKEKEKEEEQTKRPDFQKNAAYERLNFNTYLPSIAAEEIRYGKHLGMGSAGIVYEATYQGKTVAVKKLLRLTSEQVDAFQREAIIMANHRHNNLVAFLGFCLTESALMMEYMPGGALWSLLKSAEDISWQLRYQIALDVAEGMAYLHDSGIVHCDLKSENVLLDSERRAKITDFGVSALKSENSTFGTWEGGTFHWMAPEVFHTNKNSKAADVYGYGMILWQIGARKEPFVAIDRLQLIKHISKGNRENISEDTPLEIRKIIELCWLPEPPLKKATDTEQRPTIKEIRNLLGKAYATCFEKERQGQDASLEEKEKERELLMSRLESLEREKELERENQNKLLSRLENLEQEKEQQNKLLNRLLQLEEEREKEEKEKEKEVAESGLESISYLPTGSVVSFAGELAPDGWLLCDGSSYSSLVYPELYKVVGIACVPDTEKKIIQKLNQTSIEKRFYVPDLRGRVIVGVDTEVGRVTLNNTLGESGGEEHVAITISQIPKHTHDVLCSPQTQLGGPYPADILVPQQEKRGTTSTNTGSAGSGQPHNNMQPYLILNYIINAGKRNNLKIFDQKIEEKEKVRED